MRYRGNNPEVGTNGYKHGSCVPLNVCQCQMCGRDFLVGQKPRMFCSKPCRTKRQNDLAKKREISPRNRMRSAVSGRMGRALRSKKSGDVIKYLGCTMEEFQEYIVHHYMWKPWFTLENYGKVWHIDHIRPLASFPDGELEQGFHYTNCQPLAASENFRKSSHWNGKFWRKIGQA